MADVAVARDDLSRVADVLAIMAAEAPGEIHVAYIIRMRLPIGLHLREKVRLEDSLDLCDCVSYRLLPL